jgi:Fur family zinc uptake transcriptional regulator
MASARPARGGVAARLSVAERDCAARGVRLTANRRDVLEALLRADGPLSAYALLDAIRPVHPGAAPPTVYRALEFLVEQGLAHKLERLNAYVACVDGASHTHGHAAQFLICRICGGVTEMDDDAVAKAVDRAARQAGFAPAHTTVEVEGVCARCAAGQGADML